MLKSLLQFNYPEALIATCQVQPYRVAWVDETTCHELTPMDFLQKFGPEDLWIINQTRVVKRRVFTDKNLDILFLQPLSPIRWQVLTLPHRLGKGALLPEDIHVQVVERGRPQVVELSRPIDDLYFEKHGEMPLPPYIHKARGTRHTVAEDEDWYQTAWAKNSGSFAAPTASLHFTQQDLNKLHNQGTSVRTMTLHVGIGTFLPVATDDLNEHHMHAEQVEIPAETWQAILQAQAKGHRIWALGTTVLRGIEACARGDLQQQQDGSWKGETSLLIQPGFDFQIFTGLMTNFHQPESTLLALVTAFAGLEKTLTTYHWAINNNFRLFSYGDLTVWKR